MNATLIALTGPARSGKTTVAREFEDRGFVRVRFAGPLKDMLRALGLSEAQVDGDKKAEPTPLLCGKTPRQGMQTLGDQWGRQLIGEDVWVRAAMRRTDQLLAAGRNVVIDDLRYDNEALAIAQRSGYVFSLHRDGAGIDSAHSSEAGISHRFVSGFIFNNDAIAVAADTIELRIKDMQP